MFGKHGGTSQCKTSESHTLGKHESGFFMPKARDSSKKRRNERSRVCIEYP